MTAIYQTRPFVSPFMVMKTQMLAASLSAACRPL
jgi:hypothetical protein